MSPHDSLHTAAIALMALAAVVHPGIRDRECAPDLIAGVCMIAAMADAMWLRMVPVVYSMALLLAAAVAISAFRSIRARHHGEGAGIRACEISHTPLGFVVTAVCLPSMYGSILSTASAHAHHGLGAGAFTVVVVAICGGYLISSVIAARRAALPSDRAQYALMGAGAVGMALAAVVR